MAKFSKTLVDHALNFNCISRSFSIFQNNILNNVVEQIKNTFYEFNNLIIDATWVFYINYEEVRNCRNDANIFIGVELYHSLILSADIAEVIFFLH